MSEQDILHCPFCGRHNIGTDYGPYRQWVQCFCHDCGASAASCDSEVLAIAAWNTRAGEAITSGYYQVEPIGEQPPTITTTYCQGCQEKEAELAALREDHGRLQAQLLSMAQMDVERQAELAPLRALREAVTAYKGHRHPAMTEVWLALAACDEASAPTETSHVLG